MAYGQYGAMPVAMYPQHYGYGQPPAPPMAARMQAPPPAWVPDPMVGAVLEGMRRQTAAVAQIIVQTFGVRFDRNEETAWLTFGITPAVIPFPATRFQVVQSIGQEADFVATGAVAQITDGATPPVLIPGQGLRFQIVDGSTNRQLMRAALPLGFISVSDTDHPAGSRPWFLPKPRIFSRNSNVLWLFDNVQGVEVEVDVAFFGYRIYDARALDLTSMH
ncbi:MAG: hypothetical protein Q8Q14_09155 [Gemmatimonadales bacterium]|nr:hypothetical protein [Gemmatimonadales bacterium]